MLKPEDIESMAREAGFAPEQGTARTDRMFQRFYALAYARGVEDAARAAEGEADRVSAIASADADLSTMAEECARAIRALLKP